MRGTYRSSLRPLHEEHLQGLAGAKAGGFLAGHPQQRGGPEAGGGQRAEGTRSALCSTGLKSIQHIQRRVQLLMALRLPSLEQICDISGPSLHLLWAMGRKPVGVHPEDLHLPASTISFTLKLFETEVSLHAS